jgi:molecular chaperone GrpE
MDQEEKTTVTDETAAAEEPKSAETTEQPTEQAEKQAAEKPAKEKKSKKTDTAALLAENEQLKKELAEIKDQHQRILAEYANYKRRTEQEKAQIGQFTKCELLKELLPALDNLERAVGAPPGDDYKTGVDMTIRQLQKALSDMGLEPIEAENKPFDPEIHHAVMREDADGVEPDTVTQMFQKGYKVGDRVLRPAMVKVAN